jgi:hypothetical protein
MDKENSITLQRHELRKICKMTCVAALTDDELDTKTSWRLRSHMVWLNEMLPAKAHKP